MFLPNCYQIGGFCMWDLSSKYAIVGVGESERSKNSGTTPLHLALRASRNALADAGLEAKDIDAVMSYSEHDSCIHILRRSTKIRERHYWGR